MKLFRFHDPSDYRYAEAGRRGTWSPPPVGVCPECTASRQTRVPPLKIAWEPGADVIGDFTWPGFDSDIAVKDSVLATLSRQFSGFEGQPVEMVNDPARRRRKQPMVTLPYQGPRLFDLWVTAWASADRDRSTIELEYACSTCQQEQWRLRLPPDGEILLPETALDGASIFRLNEAPAWIACTEAVKHVVEVEGFTNVAFIELGSTSM